MAPIPSNSAMDKNLTTRFSWNDTRFEIGTADEILLSEPEWDVYSILSIFLTNIVIVGVDKVDVDTVIRKILGIDSKINVVRLLIVTLIVDIPMNIIGIVGAIQRRKVRAHVRACVCLSVPRVLLSRAFFGR